MAYLRWSTSRWYVYWQVTDSKRRDDQVVCIDCKQCVTYAELKTSFDAVVQAAMDRNKPAPRQPIDPKERAQWIALGISPAQHDEWAEQREAGRERGATSLDRTELELALREFMDDVKHDGELVD